MWSADIALPNESESSVFDAVDPYPCCEIERDIEAILDAAFVALVTGVITYGICEAISRWRWWAVAVWVGTSLSMPIAIAAIQQITGFLEREQ